MHSVNMKRYRKSVAVCMLIVMIALMVGCSKTINTGTAIISTENIESISVELFDQSKKTLEGEAIRLVAETLNEATLTREESVQDAPYTRPFGTITINDGEEVIFYYQKNNKYYLEKPYNGIYKITVDMNTFLSEL